ncbi:MAG: hypothetical protein AAFV53_21445 [Myxococcota bacterium]
MLDLCLLETIEYDFTADGVVDYTVHHTYNAIGALIGVEGMNAEGVIDYEEHLRYDTAGQLIEKVAEELDEGREAVRYSYDEAGNLIQVDDDYDGDGIVDAVTTYTYNAQAQPIEIFTESLNSDQTYRIQYEYDEIGRESSYRYARDEALVHLDLFFYDDRDQRIRTDRYGPDAVTRIAIFTNQYDEDGNRVASANDTNADGVPESSRQYTFDERGNEILTQIDGNNDGVFDAEVLFAYEADRLIQQAVDRDADGIADSVTDYTHRCETRTVYLPELVER